MKNLIQKSTPSALLLTLVVCFSLTQTSAQNFVWAKEFSSINYITAYDLTVDPFNNVLVTGIFSDTVDFDPNGGVYDLVADSACQTNMFVAKYDSDGNIMWAKKMSGRYNTRGYSIICDASGNSYMTGLFQDTADFDPGPGVFNLISSFSTSAFVSKLDENGIFVWAKKIGQNADVEGQSIAIDSSGNVYASGFFDGTVDFDPGATIYNLTAFGSTDAYVLKLDNNGSFLWAKQLGGVGGYINASSLTLNSGSTQIYCTGVFGNTVDFDPGVGTNNIAASSAIDCFILCLDTMGTVSWVKTIAIGTNATLPSITADNYANIILTGTFIGTPDFDPSAGVSTLTSMGSSDIFMIKFSSNGNFVWAKNMGGLHADGGTSLMVDFSGYIYATGMFKDTADFDPGLGIYNLMSDTNTIFIAKYDPNGNLVWADGMEGNYGVGISLALDNMNNIYSIGIFKGTVDFDPGNGNFDLTCNNYLSAYMLKLSNSNVGLVEQAHSPVLSIYPNPTADLVTIDLLTTVDGQAEIEVYNVTGQMIIRNSNFNGNKIILDLQGFVAGIYVLRATVNGQVHSWKIIKQ